MARWFVWLLLVPLLSGAQPFSAAEMQQLKVYSTGLFTNKTQVQADSSVQPSTLHIRLIWQKRKDGWWMLAEKKDREQLYQVWHYYLQDDTTLVLQFFDFKDAQKAAALAQDLSLQASLYLYHLSARHGCEIYLKRHPGGYLGSTSGKDCVVQLPGAGYNKRSLLLQKDYLQWQQAAVISGSEDQLPHSSENFVYNKEKKISSHK